VSGWILLLLLAAGDRLSVDVVPERSTVWVHEPVRVTLRIAYDREWFDAHAVQPFPRELGVPLQVDAAWMRGVKGARITAPGLPDHGATVALNDAVAVFARGEVREVGGRPWAVLETTRTLQADEPGVIELAAPVVRWVFASSFAEDFVHGRVPRDPAKGMAAGTPAAIRVLALPEEGRPPDFDGAVGRFAVHASAEPRTIEVGGMIRLELRIDGDGNLADFDTPRLDFLRGFHVYGALDDRATPVRTIRYDLAPLDPLVEMIPAIPFTSFDPHEPAAYRTVRTEPIPITVEAGLGGTTTSRAPEPGKRIPTLPLVATGAAALALLLRAWFRHRRRRLDRAQDAAGRFRTRLARPGADAAAALTDYLAARLECAPAAVIGPGLADRLRATGVDPDLAARAGALVERLTAARYGADDDAGDGARAARALVDELERRRPD